MTIELNRRTFLALLGATTATLATTGQTLSSVRQPLSKAGTPRHFLADHDPHPPVRPKTMAINYLAE